MQSSINKRPLHLPVKLEEKLGTLHKTFRIFFLRPLLPLLIQQTCCLCKHAASYRAHNWRSMLLNSSQITFFSLFLVFSIGFLS